MSRERSSGLLQYFFKALAVFPLRVSVCLRVAGAWGERRQGDAGQRAPRFARYAL